MGFNSGFKGLIISVALQMRRPFNADFSQGNR